MTAWPSLPRSAKIKATGYVISTFSVVLLAIVSWRSASRHSALALCLVCGATTSIIGMIMRLYSYEVEKTEPAD